MSKKKAWVKSAFSQLGAQATNIEQSPSPPKKIHEHTAATTDQTEVVENIPNAKPKHGNKMTTADWIKSFAPTCTEELAIHAKKIKEFTDWLQHCEALRKKHPAQICLLTGPSGAGKTVAVNVLAKNAQYHVLEWINPVDREVIYQLGDQATGNSYVGSQLDCFKNFLLRASRYKSLLDNSNKRLLLIEDFPNALRSDEPLFESILKDYKDYGKSPVVFIVTDTKARGINITYNLFPEQIKNKFQITHICFNPIANTLMQKALKRVCTLMQKSESSDMYKLPTQNLLDLIVAKSKGDVRRALLYLNFKSVIDERYITEEMRCGEQSNMKQTKNEQTLKSLGCDENVTMMHALGRVFNPKYTSTNKFVHSPEVIADQFVSEPKKFINFVHANYLAHFKDIENVAEAADGLSSADIMLKEYREDTLALTGLNVGIRSVMVANKTPVSGWLPVRGPKRWPAKSNKHALHYYRLRKTVAPKLYAIEYSTYVNCILGNR